MTSKIQQETHKVFNQPPALENINLFDQDTPLQSVVKKEGGKWGTTKLHRFGALLGKKSWIERGFQANNVPPEFHSHDRFGHRQDLVTFHPAYHKLMQLGTDFQLPSLPWITPEQGAHVVRMALNYLYSQNEAGTACPLSMTFAAIPVIKKSPSLAKLWLPKLLAPQYDPTNQPVEKKTGATIGMAMTEKQGGTDVRANTSYAKPMSYASTDDLYEITGHKWFCSAPMCDAFLTLAQTEQGITCFLLPRWRPDGTRNTFYIQRLKNKMGNRSNASAEVEFCGASGWRLGEEGQGISTIIEMVALTRYDCMTGSAALMRQAVAQVTHHIYHRKIFGKKLTDHPLMQNVAADLCLEAEAALVMTGRLARSLDNQHDEQEQLFTRLVTAIGKYWVCKRATSHTGEAMECLGGSGYIEESILPRLYREAPVNAIWEGSSNVQCLDVLRAMHKTHDINDAIFNELNSARSNNTLYDSYINKLKRQSGKPYDFYYESRYQVECLAKAIQAAQLIKAGNTLISDAFCQARLGDIRGINFGTLPPGINCKAIIERSRPQI